MGIIISEYFTQVCPEVETCSGHHQQWDCECTAMLMPFFLRGKKKGGFFNIDIFM